MRTHLSQIEIDFNAFYSVEWGHTHASVEVAYPRSPVADLACQYLSILPIACRRPRIKVVCFKRKTIYFSFLNNLAFSLLKANAWPTRERSLAWGKFN